MLLPIRKTQKVVRVFYPPLFLTYKELRQKVIEHLGGKCKRCGFSDYRALQIDHVNGGGSQERRNIGYDTFYRNVLSDTTGKYQLLCANCNWIKRYENNEHPISLEREKIFALKREKKQQRVERNNAIIKRKLLEPWISFEKLAEEFNLSYSLVYQVVRNNTKIIDNNVATP